MRVLLATDGSERADVARQLVQSADWPASSTIRVVTVVELINLIGFAPWSSGLAVDAEAVEAEAAAQAELVLDEAARGLAGVRAGIECAVLRGRPASCIVEDARGFNADLIVVGSRGHGMIKSMLLGSVAGEVTDHAPCPVLVARLPFITRVVLAHDGSDFARAAEQALCAWPIFGHAAIEVASISDPPGPWFAPVSAVSQRPESPDYFERARDALEHHRQIAEGAARRLRQAGLRASAVVEAGDPATAIIRLADEHRADLVALGTHGRTGLERLLLGSVARNVMQHAPVSVLIVRPREGLSEKREDTAGHIA